MTVADLAHPGEIAGRREHDAGGAGDRLEDDPCDRRRSSRATACSRCSSALFDSSSWLEEWNGER